MNDKREYWGRVFNDPSQIDLSIYDLELITATEDNKKINMIKFILLAFAYAFLITGIVVTGMVGYLVAAGIAT